MREKNKSFRERILMIEEERIIFVDPKSFIRIELISLMNSPLRLFEGEEKKEEGN